MTYSPNPAALEHALTKLTPVLRIVTMPTELDDPCDNTYSCGCTRCTQQRAALMHQGTRDVRQPWQPKKAA